ncbi:MAG: DNA polymerase I, partial [Nitrospiraceae bacterium]|nr:DNA polymerase I [Nitrospiraceae bacterium]
MTAAAPNTRPTLYLIDGSAYIYRAFFALPPLNNSKGFQTNAVYGFTTMLLKVIREHRPDGLAVVFDEKGSTQRHEEYKAYKAQRPPMPDAMSAQVPYIHRVVEALSIPAIRLAGHEADDIIGTLAKKAEGAGYDIVVVTSDKDMFQLLTSHVRIYDPVKDKWIGEAECQERFGVEPARVADIMGLMGDAIDNIPGVKGIGEKTAAKLVAQFGTLEELLSRVEEVTPPRTKAMLIQQADVARLSRRLATIQTDSPVDFDAETLHIKPPHDQQLSELLRELEFTTLLKSFQPSSPQATIHKADVDLIQSEAAAQAFVDQLAKDAPIAVQCLLSGGTGIRADVQGIALSAAERTAYIPLHGDESMGPVRALFQETSRTKAVHDLKATLLAFHRLGVTLAGPYADTMIADYLLNPNRRDHQLDTLALEMLGHRLGGQEEASHAANSLFDADTGSREQTAECAAVVAKLAPLIHQRLKEQGSLALFETVEMPLVPVLADIERNGFLLDVEGLKALSKELERDLDRIMESIAVLAGGEFNINSPKQLCVVLFEKLGLKPIRKTKTGYSTDEDTLTQLAAQHELPAQILNYRSVSKLKSTYVDALPALINPETQRLHT